MKRFGFSGDDGAAAVRAHFFDDSGNRYGGNAPSHAEKETHENLFRNREKLWNAMGPHQIVDLIRHATITAGAKSLIHHFGQDHLIHGAV